MDTDSDNMDNKQAFIFLQSLPPGIEIAWNSHHIRNGFSFGGWVDIDCPMLAKTANWNWCWTVEDPRYVDRNELDDFSFVAEFDAVLHMYLDQGKTSGVPWKLVLEQNKSSKDISYILLEEQEGYQKSCGNDWKEQMTWAWQSHQGTEEFEDIFTKKIQPAGASIRQVNSQEHIVSCPVWTPKAISQGLSDWAAKNGLNLDFIYKVDIEKPDYIQEVFKHLEDWKDNQE